MSAASETAKIDLTGVDASSWSTRHPRTWSAGMRSVSPVRKNAMQSVAELSSLGAAAARWAAKRSSRSNALLQVLRRVAHLDFFSIEDEISQAIDRAFAEFAREMRK
jgi:hypothetical protein